MDLSNGLVPEKASIDNKGLVHLSESVRTVNKDEMCLTDISPKQGTAFLVRIAVKARTKRIKLWSNRSRATYSPKLIFT